MAILQVQNSLSLAPKSVPNRRSFRASIHAPISPSKRTEMSFPKIPSMVTAMDKLKLREERSTNNIVDDVATNKEEANLVITKLYAIAEEAADRAEMHSIIGKQRNDWNALLLNSINSITLTASLMAGISSIPIGEETPYILPLKVSSVLLFTAAAGMMAAVNKIQPSQLAEEQRNAARLFKQLERSIHTKLAAIGGAHHPPTESDVEEALERVLAIQKAYPLPLLPLPDKFPKVVKPTVWWPKLKKKQQHQQQKKGSEKKNNNNGWSEELEKEMMGVLRVMKRKDEEQYVHVGELVSKINKTLAVSGPILAGIAAIGTGLIGGSSSVAHEPNNWPALVGVVGGALAVIVNTLEHGGQMGMVFELFRNCAGFYRHLEEDIENNLGETDVEKREDGELFEMKMALHLGRSLSDLKALSKYASSSSSSSSKDEDINKFAGKLF